MGILLILVGAVLLGIYMYGGFVSNGVLATSALCVVGGLVVYIIMNKVIN
ncbi:MAG: hypothetical protein LBV41_10580 [Cytophagaceae bacterium]|nr:hypothetical protein [Cytophagaceae bacterium]